MAKGVAGSPRAGQETLHAMMKSVAKINERDNPNSSRALSHRRHNKKGRSFEDRSHEAADKLLHFLSAPSCGSMAWSMDSAVFPDHTRSNLGSATDTSTPRSSTSTDFSSEVSSLCLDSDSSRSSLDSNCSDRPDRSLDAAYMSTMHASDPSYESLAREPQTNPSSFTSKASHRARTLQTQMEKSGSSSIPAAGAADNVLHPPPSPIPGGATEVRRSRSMPAANQTKDQQCREALVAHLKEMAFAHVRLEPTEEQKNDPAFAFLVQPLTLTEEPVPSTAGSAPFGSAKMCTGRLPTKVAFELPHATVNIKAALTRVLSVCKAHIGLYHDPCHAQDTHTASSEAVDGLFQSKGCRSQGMMLKRAQIKAARAEENETLYVVKHRSCPASACPFGLETIREVPILESEYRCSCSR